MAITTVPGGGSNDTGELVADTYIEVKSGSLDFNTDDGGGYGTLDAGDRIIISSGETVYLRNSGTLPVTFVHFGI